MKEDLFESSSVEETQSIGFNFAKNLKKGDVIAFYGDLGVGKTEFIRGICKFYNISSGVSSPTYTIINEYEGNNENKPVKLFHLDLYRIKEAEELIYIGYHDYVFQDEGITLIEWAENSFDELPHKHIKVIIETTLKNDKRILKIKSLNRSK